MRQHWILFIFTILTSLIAWNSIEFSLTTEDRIKENLEEQIEYESSSQEEESENEHLNTIQVYFSRETRNMPIFVSSASFHYSFSINSHCKEPEVYPPRC